MVPAASHGRLNTHNELTGVHIDLEPLRFDSTYIHVNPGDIFKPVTNYSLPPPSNRPADDRGVSPSDWWALLSFVFDNQRRTASGAIHLPCHRRDQGSQAVWGEVWSSLRAAAGAR